MKALVLESVGKLSLREIDLPATLGPEDVRIAIGTVGICGSDIHYYQHGSIGPFVVKAPMVLGHEASGVVTETGKNVKGLTVGDRVCMEPGIPDPNGKATRLGIYNLDPSVRFWATPPIHGCLCESVVHPAAFTFKLPDNVSAGEAAMVEPLAVGMHAATKASIKPGDVAVVTGAGTIGMMTALSALAGGCSRVIMTDVVQEKLDIASRLGAITPVNVSRDNAREAVDRLTGGWGADIVFEASGSERAASGAVSLAAPGGRVVFIGMPAKPLSFDVVEAQAKEVTILTIFRYAHVYPRAVALIAAGKIDLKPLITDTYSFADAVRAFEYAANPQPRSVKTQIVVKA